MFTSKSLLGPQSLTSSENFTRLNAKAGKVLGGRNEQQNNVHIYKMRCENSLSRQWSTKSLRNFDKEEETMSSSSQGSVSDEGPITIDADRHDQEKASYSVDNKLNNASQHDNIMRQPSDSNSNTSSPGLRPSRHMLVIPDTSNKDRIVEVNVNYKSGSTTIMDSNPNSIVCPSPDSGVLDDYHSVSTHRMMNKVDPLHCSSSPCILSDSVSRRSSLPTSSILGQNS